VRPDTVVVRDIRRLRLKICTAQFRKALIVKPSTTYDACNHALGSNSRVRGSKKAESTLNRIEENNVQHLVDATKKAMVDENWYAALTMALSMPDMCGRLESPHKKSQERYEIWFTKYALECFSKSVRLLCASMRLPASRRVRAGRSAG
jgi:thiaminase